MPIPFEHLVAPSDWRMVREARRRGGKRAAERVIRALANRICKTARERDKLRQLLMSDEADHAWPPSFTQRK
jgi:hypothetical protein